VKKGVGSYKEGGGGGKTRSSVQRELRGVSRGEFLRRHQGLLLKKKIWGKRGLW